MIRKPVYIAGVGQASSGKLSAQKDIRTTNQGERAVRKAGIRMAGIGPDDVDLCELHDCFSIASIIAAESLGFAEYGKAGEMWQKGQFDRGGKVAINMSGGLKAKGHPIGATGASQAVDIVHQMRGEAEPGRQVEDVKFGLTDTLGGDGVLCNMVLKRGW
jgi:acetyl-CoA C-acetyltransferase/acetyl-CoA acyltransferase